MTRFDLFRGSALDYRAGVREKAQVCEIVGVAKDAQMEAALDRPKPALYFPLRTSQFAWPSLEGITLMARGVPGADVPAAVRREVAAMDAGLPVFDARSMTRQIEEWIFPIQVAISTYGVMGLFVLILSAVGLAGVTAYSVTRRRHEIGIRIALGAGSRDVLGLVMKEGAVPVAVGTTIGLAGAWGAMRVLAASVEATARVASRSASVPALLVGAPILLAALALVAGYVPARRSVEIDPVVTLRQE